MASPSMEIPAIHGWNMLLVGETSDEMYRMVLWKFLLSMDIPSIHGWKADIHGWQDPWVECNTYM